MSKLIFTARFSVSLKKDATSERKNGIGLDAALIIPSLIVFNLLQLESLIAFFLVIIFSNEQELNLIEFIGTHQQPL